ncbi:methyltransferase domain-containing protein [Actinomadura barringtoniae]|uniref:Methyltransferase domain-containing protein n=1 Tax=Actinomadura barringtoniae TaxID=1427535 RepID=A0A939PM59_9ACTN|nr:class I SAM-dependent methyltransferase [Actinomadura barringtoniae]MBO2454850.1 methyltransferase domain-containing protein [Actinomadura barringtoniae]
MAGIVNTHQSEAWNGYEGRHWADHHDRYDALNSTYNERLLDAAGVGSETNVLDIGCGNGQVTRQAARRASHGSALGVDLSGPMLTTARHLAESEGITNVTFEQGDVQVHPFKPESLDAAISRFAIMFFADPVAAFTNIARALRPNGRLAFLSMTDLAGTDLATIMQALAPHLPPTGQFGSHGSSPLSLSEPAHIKTILTSAGFHDVATEHIEGESIWGSDAADAAGFFMGWGPVRFNLGDADPAPAHEAVETAFRPFERDHAVRLTGTAWLTTAHYDAG